jgi:hypothetical protein
MFGFLTEAPGNLTNRCSAGVVDNGLRDIMLAADAVLDASYP